MDMRNTKKKARSAFVPQEESASKLLVGVFTIVMLILAGVIFYVFTI